MTIADTMTGRYEIANGDSSWQDAERQIEMAAQKGGKSTTVSVRTGKDSKHGKRKAGEALEEAQKEAAGLDGKKSKKGKKSK